MKIKIIINKLCLFIILGGSISILLSTEVFSAGNPSRKEKKEKKAETIKNEKKMQQPEPEQSIQQGGLNVIRGGTDELDGGTVVGSGADQLILEPEAPVSRNGTVMLPVAYSTLRVEGTPGYGQDHNFYISNCKRNELGTIEFDSCKRTGQPFRLNENAYLTAPGTYILEYNKSHKILDITQSGKTYVIKLGRIELPQGIAKHFYFNVYWDLSSPLMQSLLMDMTWGSSEKFLNKDWYNMDIVDCLIKSKLPEELKTVLLSKNSALLKDHFIFFNTDSGEGYQLKKYSCWKQGTESEDGYNFGYEDLSMDEILVDTTDQFTAIDQPNFLSMLPGMYYVKIFDRVSGNYTKVLDIRLDDLYE